MVSRKMHPGAQKPYFKTHTSNREDLKSNTGKPEETANGTLQKYGGETHCQNCSSGLTANNDFDISNFSCL